MNARTGIMATVLNLKADMDTARAASLAKVLSTMSDIEATAALRSHGLTATQAARILTVVNSVDYAVNPKTPARPARKPATEIMTLIALD